MKEDPNYSCLVWFNGNGTVFSGRELAIDHFVRKVLEERPDVSPGWVYHLVCADWRAAVLDGLLMAHAQAFSHQ